MTDRIEIAACTQERHEGEVAGIIQLTKSQASKADFWGVYLRRDEGDMGHLLTHIMDRPTKEEALCEAIEIAKQISVSIWDATNLQTISS